MSFSFEQNFRTRESARRTVMKAPGLPEPARDFLLAAINHLPDDTDDRFIMVAANGHLCDGTGSYVNSSAVLTVTPYTFAPVPMYGRTTA